MTRIDTIIQLDSAIDQLKGVQERMIDMACTSSMDRRINALINKLEDLRVDILQADLPGEKEVIFIPR